MNRPSAAYYVRGQSGWRAWWSLLHPPYTLMHLSFVVVGATLSPIVNLCNLAATLLAFFLALGVAAHVLGELSGRPIGTTIPQSSLVGAAIVGLGSAVAIAIAGVIITVEGKMSFQDGTTAVIDSQTLLGPLEGALRWLVRTSVPIALTLFLMQLWRGEWISGL
jgi:hypothetical protein